MDSTSGLLPVTPRRLRAEYLASLHARNIDSNEALKLERSQAVAAKHDANTRKAAKNAKLGTKNANPTVPTSVKKTQRPNHSDSDQDGPLQNRPTSWTAIALSDVTLDWPVASKADIQGRWQTSLLAGGTHGSISLSQKEQRVHNAAAIALQSLKFHNHEADSMYHHTFEAHRLQDAVDLAIMQSEAEVDAAVDAALDTIDPDVIDKHLR